MKKWKFFKVTIFLLFNVFCQNNYAMDCLSSKINYFQKLNKDVIKLVLSKLDETDDISKTSQFFYKMCRSITTQKIQCEIYGFCPGYSPVMGRLIHSVAPRYSVHKLLNICVLPLSFSESLPQEKEIVFIQLAIEEQKTYKGGVVFKREKSRKDECGVFKPCASIDGLSSKLLWKCFNEKGESYDLCFLSALFPGKLFVVKAFDFISGNIYGGDSYYVQKDEGHSWRRGDNYSAIPGVEARHKSLEFPLCSFDGRGDLVVVSSWFSKERLLKVVVPGVLKVASSVAFGAILLYMFNRYVVQS